MRNGSTLLPISQTLLGVDESSHLRRAYFETHPAPRTAFTECSSASRLRSHTASAEIRYVVRRGVGDRRRGRVRPTAVVFERDLVRGRYTFGQVDGGLRPGEPVLHRYVPPDPQQQQRS